MSIFFRQSRIAEMSRSLLLMAEEIEAEGEEHEVDLRNGPVPLTTLLRLCSNALHDVAEGRGGEG